MYPIMRRLKISSLSLSKLLQPRTARNRLLKSNRCTDKGLPFIQTASFQEGTIAANSIWPRDLVLPTTTKIQAHHRALLADRYMCFVRYSNGSHEKEVLSDLEYEKIADQTLDHLSEFFEILGDSENCPSDFDVMYSSGVLTVAFGPEHGTYVINKQTPNKQIWLSSPTSGPKRYDYINRRWIYAHDGMAIHDLLSEEISKILDSPIDVTEAEQWDT